MQVVVVCLLAFTLFAAAFEQSAVSAGRYRSDVGAGIYALLIPLFFSALIALAVPLQAVESLRGERRSSNWDLLMLTPIGHRRLLLGKLIAALIAASWSIWLAVPLFWLALYTGGLSAAQLGLCALVSLAGFMLFCLIGMHIALSPRPDSAVWRSYAVVLSFVLLPLIVSTWSPLVNVPTAIRDLLRALSPLSVLIAIVGAQTQSPLGIAPIWVWMLSCYAVLSVTLFCIVRHRISASLQ